MRLVASRKAGAVCRSVEQRLLRAGVGLEVAHTGFADVMHVFAGMIKVAAPHFEADAGNPPQNCGHSEDHAKYNPFIKSHGSSQFRSIPIEMGVMSMNFKGLDLSAAPRNQSGESFA